MTKKGKLIIVDGMDGAGKTTAIEFIKKSMTSQGIEFESVNILSGHPATFQMRKIVTNKQLELSRKSELLLYAAAISNTYQLEILPRLNKGINVLVDRGPLSNFAYQIQTTYDPYFNFWRQMYSDFETDATFILTCDIETGLERCKSRDGVLDRLESRPIEYHAAVQKAYLDVVDMARVSTGNNLQNVFSEITGGVVWYSNNSSLERLEEMCDYFVQKALTTSA